MALEARIELEGQHHLPRRLERQPASERDRAAADLASQGPLPVPLHLRNAPTRLLQDLGYGEDYVYPHDTRDGFVGAENLPEALRGARYYEPRERGAEKEIARRLAAWRARRDAEPA